MSGFRAIGRHSLLTPPLFGFAPRNICFRTPPDASAPFMREDHPMAFKSAKLTAVVAFASLSQTFLSSTGAAQTARVELHPIKTITLTDQQFLNGAKSGPEVIIGGELRLPKLGSDRLPAVVLLHGSSGIAAYVNDWVPVLNSLGTATFLVDSFAGRGITSVGNDQGQLGRLVQVFDSYRALDLLANHPRIDAE